MNAHLSKVKEHLRRVDPVLIPLLPHLDGFSMRVTETPFIDLIDAIISQQLSERAGATIVDRVKSSFPPGGITPEAILKRTDQELRSLGISWSKATYLKSLALAISNGELVLEELPSKPDEEVITTLTHVKGIGRWTAEMFLMFSLGREDVFSYGDLGLRRAMGKLYKFRDYPTPKQMEKIVTKWRPYRTIVARMLWASLDAPDITKST